MLLPRLLRLQHPRAPAFSVASLFSIAAPQDLVLVVSADSVPLLPVNFLAVRAPNIPLARVSPDLRPARLVAVPDSPANAPASVRAPVDSADRVPVALARVLQRLLPKPRAPSAPAQQKAAAVSSIPRPKKGQ